MELEICTLKKENSGLKRNNEHLQEELVSASSELKNIKAALKNHFGPGQIKHLMNPTKTFRWTPLDIASAISLRSVSPKGYRYLRRTGYPLPALSTLRRWALNLNLNQGVLRDIIKLLKQKSLSLSEVERVCVLAFDEIYISNKMCIDKKEEKVLGPHKSCQVAIVRGLFASWKQPIYYKFDAPMTKNDLFDILSSLYSAGYTIVSITSDMGVGNQKLWSELNVGHDKNSFFTHPSDQNKKVFVFADVPHLLKLIRNHFLDQGFKIGSNDVNKSCIIELLAASSDDIKIVHKVTDYHLSVRGSERQKVKPAAQLLSATLAKALEWCGSRSLFSNFSWKETSKFLGLINDWFDTFNSKAKYGSHPGVNAFGTALEAQIQIVNQATEVIANMAVGKHKSLVPFQKGIILSNHSLLELHTYLTEKYNITYIITYRLNQDVVENFFSYIRGMGATNDHPDPLQVKYRIRWYVLGKHSLSVFTMNNNTEEDSEPCLSAKFLANTVDSAKFSEEKTTENDYHEEESLLQSSTFIEPEYDGTNSDGGFQSIEDFREGDTFSDAITNQGLKYIAGYVAHRFKNKYKHLDLGVSTKTLDVSHCPDWIEFVSRGHLMYPSEELIQLARILDSEFRIIHGETLIKEPLIFKRLADVVIENNPNIGNMFPYEIILCMARTRIYIRLRNLNKKISFLNCKRTLEKKLSKFTNTKK